MPATAQIQRERSEPGTPCQPNASASLALAIILFFALPALAGGPLYVAGTGFTTLGKPLTWNNGQISYYTDQGDLSPVLTQSSANALVSDAFSRWTSVPTAALAATRAGSLDEDVNAANVTFSGGVLTMPADIQPSSAKPFAFVYDADGKVIEALLGTGASAPQNCLANAVVGGPDRFTPDGHIAHALLILNGNCATSQYLLLLRYALVRMIGRSLGLDWSQLNDNVFTGSPPPSTDDKSGFPIMHPEASLCSVDYGCGFNADQLRLDDRAALSRLYPVTGDNLSQFPGKTLSAASTARIRGRILFPGWNGAPGAGMQGVNVVARYIDPSTHTASRIVAASAVSGVLFHGNAGNSITGFTSATGERFDHWGSADLALRGEYDLSCLEIPAGAASAQFQLTTEPLNRAYTGALAVGPYKLAQVTPSGTSLPVVVTVTKGGEVVQDIVMQSAAAQPSDPYEPHSFAQPGVIPGSGHWIAALSDYADFDWHAFPARANRTFTLDVTARDESGAATGNKALPVIGLWTPDAAATDAPLVAQTWFNAAGYTTRLQATIPASGTYKLAITDARGDGRPDFAYSARQLYADEVSPTHALPGTVLRVTGIGFAPGITAKIGGLDAPVLSYAVNELLLSAPTLPDGAHDLALTDPATGATAAITGAVTYGSGPGDKLELLLGWNPPVPVGTQAPNPFRVRVLTADGVPVIGASVTFTTAATTVSLLPCNTASCLVATDSTGEADIWMLIKAAGAATITASLPNGQATAATVDGVTGSLQISAVPPKIYVAAGTTASVPLLARVVGNGVPLPGRMVEFQVLLGSGSLTSATVTTNSAGEARTSLNVANVGSEVRVSACVGAAPATQCDIFYLYAVNSSAGTQLLKAGGDEQYVTAGDRFAPVSVRVFDLNQPPNTLAGVAVTFRITAFRASGGSATRQTGEVITGHRSQPAVLSSSETVVYSDGWGQAFVAPQFPAAWGAIEVQILASIPSGQTVTFTLHSLPAPGATGNTKPMRTHRARE